VSAAVPDPRAALHDRYGERARVSESFGELTVDVAPELWTDAAAFARDGLGMTFFDWLTSVDDPPDHITVVAHVYDLTAHRHLLLRTSIDRADPHLATITDVYKGANWHERETHEMFGVVFDGHPDLRPLLLPDGFAGHPLRKDFVLTARVTKPWPGAKEPGESDRDAPRRRRLLPPGVPADWGGSDG